MSDVPAPLATVLLPRVTAQVAAERVSSVPTSVTDALSVIAVPSVASTVRVLVSGSTEWDLAETTALLRADTQVAGYTFGFTFTSPELAEYIAANMPGVSVIPVPYNPDWTSVGGVSDALRALVAGVVPSGAGAGGR